MYQWLDTNEEVFETRAAARHAATTRGTRGRRMTVKPAIHTNGFVVVPDLPRRLRGRHGAFA